ncbi:Histidinol-phosphate aminotransferase [Croceitalea dokdonensis DOKDO 023]|uniref:Histidinol-phosphate aminotransferase n=1 Tax=Croceitalea dokdonensis DOKDO 023 TaxID=1300341 RepID=A0A0P7B240_9FLAO|nr:histidinol-phosphate transaminase [Croceitalea dokdonensis]KPM33346.1 Histidinol-phosphate aminotransferase [Croceitalea dokdonensis DOKDO 023]
MTFNLNNIIRKNVSTLKPYSSARDEYVATGANMVFLDANENPNNNGVNRYPDPHQRSLKSAIADIKGVSQKQILLGNGSDEVLDLLFRAFCEPGKDHVITLPPTYGMYGVLANINAVENRQLPLTPEFQPNLEAIEKAQSSSSKLLFICSPNNPTGNLFNQAKIEWILANFNGLVVIDEAYIDFADIPSWATRLHEFPNLVVIQTLSKAYGMAAVRLGLCFASEAIVNVLKKIKPPYNVNELTQQRALTGILDQQTVQEQIGELVRQRTALANQLKGISFIRKIYPSEANFILIKVDDADLRYRQLMENGIVVRNRSTQTLCENTLRLTVGTTQENKKLVNVLTNIMKDG